MRLRRALVLVLCGPVVGLALYGALGPGRAAADAAARDGMRATLAALADDAGGAGRDVDEAYLHVLRLQTAIAPGASRATAEREAFAAAEAAYNRRQADWDSRLADPELRAALLVDAHRRAAAFFRLVHEQVLPRLERGGPDATDRLLNTSLADAYDAHRAALGHAVDLLRERAATAAGTAAEAADDARRVRLTAAIVAGAATTITAAGLTALRHLGRPLRAAANAPAHEPSAPADDAAALDDDERDWAALLLAAGLTAAPEGGDRHPDGPRPGPLVTADGR
jgi:hypothetical protein